MDEFEQVLGCGIRNDLGLRLVRRDADDAGDWEFATLTATHADFDPVAPVHILGLAADIGLVNLDSNGIQEGVGFPGLSDPMGEIPGRRLSHAQVLCQLKAGPAFRMDGQQVNGNSPFSISQL